MAKNIKLKDKNGNILYPLTKKENIVDLDTDTSNLVTLDTVQRLTARKYWYNSDESYHSYVSPNAIGVSTSEMTSSLTPSGVIVGNTKYFEDNIQVNGQTIQFPTDLTSSDQFAMKSELPTITGGYKLTVNNTGTVQQGIALHYLGKSTTGNSYGWLGTTVQPLASESAELDNVSMVVITSIENALITNITSNTLYGYDGVVITKDNIENYVGKMAVLMNNDCEITIADDVARGYYEVSGLGNATPSNVHFTANGEFSFNFEEVTISGNVFIKIPTMYRKATIISDSQINTYVISTYKIDSTYQPYPCFVDENGNTLPYILIGKYLMSSTTIAKSVNATYVTMTTGAGRSLAQALGTGYQLYDLHIHELFHDLVCCYKQSINTNDGTGFNEILGIAHLNYGFLIDGITQTNGVYAFSYKPSKYVDRATTSTDGYNSLSYSCPTSDGEIQALGYDSNHPFVNQPKTITSNSSYNTYYCDGFYYSSGSHPLICNVGYALASDGVFHSNFRNDWSVANGVRLCYRPINE